MWGVGVYVWRGRACGQLVFVFTSKEPWIRGGEKIASGRGAELPLSKAFLLRSGHSSVALVAPEHHKDF